jgi:hypothetical protein
MQDVVIGTIKNYDWPQIAPFANSVHRSGFSGSKVMFVENITSLAHQKLAGLGWQLEAVVADPAQSYATARHLPVRDFLAANWESYRFALYVDVRDAVFQSDPSTWLEAHLAPAELVGPSECVCLGDQDLNSRWIRETMGEEAEKWLSGFEVLCCGTIVGRAGAVAEVVEKMCELSQKISGWGYDQAYFNYLLRIPPLQAVTRVLKMREGFIATCSWFMLEPWKWAPYLIDEAPVFDRERVLVCVPGSGVPFPILHQYDRDLWWKAAIESKYSDQ